MSRLASLALMFATLFFSVSAISASSSQACQDAARTASQLAQDYRQAVGKVRLACDRSSAECDASRAQADTVLNLVLAANEAVRAACTFASPPGPDDSLPVTASTVLAAIDSLPDSVLIPCNTTTINGFVFEIGCTSGSLVSVPTSNVNVSSSASPNVFNYSAGVSVSGSFPVRSLLGSCTLTLTSPATAPVLVTGSATFSSSSAGGPVNRLQLRANPISLQSLNLSGCGIISDIISLLGPYVFQFVETQIVSLLSQRFCGAVGPELFGTCP